LGEWVEDEPGGESDLDVAGIPSVRRRRRLGTSWLTMRLLLGQQEVSELSRLAGVGEALGTPCDQDWTGPGSVRSCVPRRHPLLRSNQQKAHVGGGNTYGVLEYRAAGATSE